MASYHQTLGPTQGWFIDPDTLDVMIHSAAMKDVTELLKVRCRKTMR